MQAREYKEYAAKYRAKHEDYEAQLAEMHNFQDPEVRTFTLNPRSKLTLTYHDLYVDLDPFPIGTFVNT